ncbi:hypothetical protein JOD24_001295 [Kroppenstedtia sanguinis]
MERFWIGRTLTPECETPSQPEIVLSSGLLIKHKMDDPFALPIAPIVKCGFCKERIPVFPPKIGQINTPVHS